MEYEYAVVVVDIESKKKGSRIVEFCNFIFVRCVQFLLAQYEYGINNINFLVRETSGT